MIDLRHNVRKSTRKKTLIEEFCHVDPFPSFSPRSISTNLINYSEEPPDTPIRKAESSHVESLACERNVQTRLQFQTIAPENFVAETHYRQICNCHVYSGKIYSHLPNCPEMAERRALHGRGATVSLDPKCKYSVRNVDKDLPLSCEWGTLGGTLLSSSRSPSYGMLTHQRKLSLGLWNIMRLLFLSLFLVFHSVSSQDDLRCFLLQGGSVQNFFVSESKEVGNSIGTLNIGGDPGINGDIYLRLESPNAPVQISANSKDLILTQKLDKEGKNGLNHVVLNVICQKKKMNDVDTIIPIVIRVTDSNDNAPVFSDAPYVVNVSEATVVGTVILGEIHATDDDQKGPYSTVQYSIAPGPHSDKFAFESPLSATLQLTAPLDYETEKKFNLTIVARDHGSPPQRTETYVTVQVIDSDDQNPAFTRQRYMAFLPEPPAEGSVLTVQPEVIKAEDQDMGIRAPVVYSLGKDVEEASLFAIDPKSGIVRINRDIPSEALQQPIVLSVVATQEDNPDRVASAILTISRRGSFSTQLQFLQRSYEATVLESLPKGSLIAQTLINKNPAENIRFGLERGGMGMFEVNPAGRIILGHKLDYERQNSYQFRVIVTDGEYNDSATVKVKVLNVNDWDPRFQYPQYEFFVSSMRVQPGDIVGNVTAADGDNDHISFSVRGRDASMFDINSSGEILIRRFLELNSTEAHIVLVAKDTGEPPRQSSVPVTIHFPQGLVRISSMDNSSNFLLMVVFGSLVAIFVLVIVCLAIYIHKNKKFRDDNDAALPTKMSQIMSNGAAGGKVDPLSMVGQQRRKEVTVVETARGLDSTSDTNSQLRRGYQNGSLRASTISVRSQGSTLEGNHSLQGSRRFLRNPLANGSLLGGGGAVTDGADSVSLNGSNATTASTATVGSDSPQTHGSSRSSTPNAVAKFFTGKRSTVAPAPPSNGMSSFSTFDGTARATGGLPHGRMAPAPPGTRMAPIPPTPPVPPTTPKQGLAPTTSSQSTSSDSSLPNSSRGVMTLRRGQQDPAKKIVWPSASIPKKVKKLSWEDELNSQTEMNPEVSVTPMPPSSSCQDSPNLTVYF